MLCKAQLASSEILSATQKYESNEYCKDMRVDYWPVFWLEEKLQLLLVLLVEWLQNHKNTAHVKLRAHPSEPGHSTTTLLIFLSFIFLWCA